MAYYPLKIKDNSGNTHTVGDPRTANKADLASPTFTGTPTAPTAAANTNTTQIATTAFVSQAVSSAVPALSTTYLPSTYGHSVSGVYSSSSPTDPSLYGGLTGTYFYIYSSFGFIAGFLNQVNTWPGKTITFVYSNSSTITVTFGASALTVNNSSGASSIYGPVTVISTTGSYPSSSNYPGAGAPWMTSWVEAKPDGSVLKVTGSQAAWGQLTAGQIPTLSSTKVSTVDINSQAASYTLVLADASKLILMTSGSAQTVTIPPNSSVAFPVGTKIDIIQTGAGQCDVAPGAGVTLNSDTNKRKVNVQYAAVSCIKTATDTWLLVGALKA